MIKGTIRSLFARAGYDIRLLPRPENVGLTHPDIEPAFAEDYTRCAPYTMTSVERMYALWQATRRVCADGTPGDIVECGVWRGGSSMLAASTLLASGDTERRLWLYDTFEGMTEPTGRDIGIGGLRVADEWDRIVSGDDPILCVASLEDVQANMASTGFPADRLQYVQGPVEQTIPDQVPDAIALLRLDTDWYESTRHELEHLWDRLSPGGVLIIDDYGHWEGAREAVDEFFAGRLDAPLLVRIDYTGRIGIKR
ncbi:unannotated protein [freshwater metagenome]|uniref:Unannotated protein n=1 Tax=freshwater metagenome TaxID=449393 RepID=A0A6J7HXH0_9ZZZZ|nr:macrocin O-methyltransferase [Actinomycetota bacterium]